MRYIFSKYHTSKKILLLASIIIFSKKRIDLLLILTLFFCCSTANAQTRKNTFYKIANINIEGNKHTKSFVIFRELPFKIGDSISKKNIAQKLLQAKTQVYNTNLFLEVKIDTTIKELDSLTIKIVLKERWYIYPVPQVVFIDRFNEWLKTFNADLKRISYGVKFSHNNFTGRRDKLSITLLNGYARNISIGYSNPYSNAKLTKGFSVSAGFSQIKEVTYKTNENNKLLNYKTNDFVRNNFIINAAYFKRTGFFKTSYATASLNYIKIADTFITNTLNKNYFNNNKSYELFTDFSYGISYANTDKNAYPTKGLTYNASILKRGLGFNGGINLTRLQGTVAKYFAYKNNFYSSIQAAAIVKLPFNQAYINQRAIGFGYLNMRGLELYTVDGVAAVTTSFTFSKQILSLTLPLPFKVKALPYVPINVFVKTYSDFGYSYLPSNQYQTKLNNKFLYSGGFGVDIVSLYDVVLKVEYSFNQLGEKGLFLHGGNF